MSADLAALIELAEDAGITRVYKAGSVPNSPALPYAVISLDSGQRKSTRVGGWSPNLRRRFVVQMFGSTHDSVLATAAKADEAFYDQRLTTVTGSPFSWRELATPPARDPDASGVMYALHTYRI